MDRLALPPDLERFTQEAIAAGRFRDVDHVVEAGVGLLQRQEQARSSFISSLEEAQAGSERNGWHDLEDVLAEADDIIASMHNPV